MLQPVPSRAHLTYCTNVHPGESLAELRRIVEHHAPEVRARLNAEGPLGLGLRISAQAARELRTGTALAEFRELLEARSFYVFTLNGFPFGPFHGTPIKEAVYLPDWTDERRLAYTEDLIAILDGLLPPGFSGSISTVPGGFRKAATSAAHLGAIAQNLGRVCGLLDRVEDERGRRIVLALEPEPECLLETTAGTLEFFERLRGGDLFEAFARGYGHRVTRAETALRQYLGVCLDTCHAAIEFESPLAAYRSYQGADILVPKVQISTGLRLDPSRSEQLQALARFDEPVYLHQVVQRNGGLLTRFLDLPEAFASGAETTRRQEWSSDAEWRVHFHVPIFTDQCGAFRSTQADLVPLLEALGSADGAPHLEVETYTWSVLPDALRTVPLAEAIARELEFAAGALAGKPTEAR